MKQFALFSFFALLISSCQLDQATNVSRADFYGSWTCDEYEGDFAPQTYIVQVEAFGNNNQIHIYGFYNVGNGQPVLAEVQSNSIFIYNQMVDGIEFSGSGRMLESLDQVDLTFTANDGSGIDHVRATWYR